MQDYFKLLKIFQPIEKEKYIIITPHVAMDINYDILKFRVIPTENGYTVCDNGKKFSEFSHSAKYYYDLFMEKDPNYRYEIKLDGNIIYKKYPSNFNVRVAVNEFVRFFVHLDEFILKNNLT
ncbi:MAG: hypothetical protein IJX17_05425 [Clostridia bacterium]|nr:hypothetical protein [Clostridia bacterium]